MGVRQRLGTVIPSVATMFFLFLLLGFSNDRKKECMISRNINPCIYSTNTFELEAGNSASVELQLLIFFVLYNTSLNPRLRSHPYHDGNKQMDQAAH